MVIKLIIFILLTSSTLWSSGNVQILGRGVSKFTLDKLIYKDALNNVKQFEKNWVVQQAARGSSQPSWSVEKDGLHVLSTGGTTIWLKKEFEGPIAILYKARIDLDKLDRDAYKKWKTDPHSVKGSPFPIVPSDINCFWMASDRYLKKSVLNKKLYNGRFSTYHVMSAYYASTGGRANTTSRARIYPRYDENRKNISHALFTGKDELPGSIITPEKEMSFQLIAVDGFVQYTLNGNVMYEYDYGDEIQTTADNGKTVETTIYTRKKYPAYDKGHFGLRMVRSAHIYTDVEVWKLVKK